jgi:hypothetical protein
MPLLFAVRWRSARGMIEWLCTQGPWNPEDAIILGTAACYRRAKVGRSHDGAHSNNTTLHTGTVRPHTGFVGSLFSISPRTGHGSSQVLEMLPVFFGGFRERALFVRVMTYPYFSVGPPTQEETLTWLPRRAGSSRIPWYILVLVKKTLRRHRAGF